MSWTNLLPNQMVTFTNAQTKGAALKFGQSHVNSNRCMTKSDILAKYNVDISGYADNQLVPKSIWNISGFFITLTVGGSNQFGYRQGSYGSITNANITNLELRNATLTDLYWLGNTLAIGIINGSTTSPPNGWAAISIGNINYRRTSFSFSYNSPTNRWLYTLVTTTNPFGTTFGATRTVAIAPL